MTTKEIIKLKKEGKGRDSIYEIAAGNYGLYGIAFFGHRFSDRRKQKTAKDKLQRVWKRILVQFPEN